MKFKVGDMVEVFRREPRSRIDWVLPQMDEYVNNGIYEIKEYYPYTKANGKLGDSYLLEKDCESFWFPEHCLRLAKGYTPPTKQELVCIKIKAMYQRRKEAGYAF